MIYEIKCEAIKKKKQIYYKYLIFKSSLFICRVSLESG